MRIRRKGLPPKTAVGVAAGTAALAPGSVALRRRGVGDVKHSMTVAVPMDEVERRWQESARAADLLRDLSPGSGRTQQLVGRRLEVEIALEPAPDGRGSEIRVEARGRGARDASDHLRSDLRRIKSILEAGEALTVEDQPSARGPLARHLTNRMSNLLRRKGRG